MNAYDFHPPRNLYGGAIDTLRQSSREKLWDGVMKRIRELYEVSAFGVGFALCKREAVLARLSDEEPADGQLNFSGGILDIQTTVRLREGRRPNLEYKQGHEIPPEPEATLQETTEWIKAAVGDKVGKRYSRGNPLYLLVHANFKKEGLDQAVLTDAVEELKQGVFDEIWLLASIISKYPHPFAIMRLHPRAEDFLAYDIASNKVIEPREMHFPFGPFEIRAGKLA